MVFLRALVLFLFVTAGVFFALQALIWMVIVMNIGEPKRIIEVIPIPKSIPEPAPPVPNAPPRPVRVPEKEPA